MVLLVKENRYQACLKEMFSLQRFGIKLGLDVIQGILHLLGDPHLSYGTIHIAGTNGKGSVASSLATILHAAGFRTGLYTSPHLVKFNERIQIDCQPIDDDRVVTLYEAVRRANQADRSATFFEFATAMALYEFAQCGVEWAVIETGMGGRLDATNIIQPQLTIITNIALEHQEYLGQRITQIAREKAGIIKPQIPLITGATQRQVIALFEQIAHACNAPCYHSDQDFQIRTRANGRFDFQGVKMRLKDLKTNLIGTHQLDNAALVLAACENLSLQGVTISEKAIRNGLANTRWPGRLEKVHDSPLVIFDGAHNVTAARILSEYIESQLKDNSTTLVIGILDDKPYEAMLKSLAPRGQHIILTKPKINRAISPKKLLDIVLPLNPNVEIIEDVETALQTAIARSNPSDAVCVAGSLYVIGEAKAALDRATISSQ